MLCFCANFGSAAVRRLSAVDALLCSGDRLRRFGDRLWFGVPARVDAMLRFGGRL